MKTIQTHILFSLFLILSSKNIWATNFDKYFGAQSVEAVLTFEAQAEIPLNYLPKLEELNQDTKARNAVWTKVYEQIHHLMGSFQSLSFQESFGYSAVLGEKMKIRFTSIEKTKNWRRKLVSYHFEGTIVVDKAPFEDQAIVSIPVVLPLAYDKIYKLGVVRGENLCTDEHYNSRDDFFYFWDPEKKDCPLKGNTKDVLRVEGKLKRLDNTTRSYPEYHKLYSSREGKELNIALYLGYIDDVESLYKPMYKDDAMVALKEIEEHLASKDFSKIESKNAFVHYRSGKEGKGINFYRHYKKLIKTKLGQELYVNVKILLGDTSIESEDDTFHYYIKNSYENDDIVIYDGHSGLGANLSLDYLPRIKFKQDFYQIFIFNGCSSYPYYNASYFKAKGGSENLDIVTSGLATLTYTMGENMKAFLAPFIEGDLDSWQSYLNRVEKSNMGAGTYLTGVNGDEDNQFIPWRRVDL